MKEKDKRETEERKRKWGYTLRDIAEASGVPLKTVRDHSRIGKFRASDILSVSGYVVWNKIKLGGLL